MYILLWQVKQCLFFFLFFLFTFCFFFPLLWTCVNKESKLLLDQIWHTKNSLLKICMIPTTENVDEMQWPKPLPSSLCVLLSCVWLFVNPWTITCQAPLSMEFSSQEYLSWVPISYSRGFFPDPGIIPTFPVSPALAGRFFDSYCWATWEATPSPYYLHKNKIF